MANMVDAACMAVMVVIAHCLSVGVAIASMLRRAVAFSTRRSAASCSGSPAGLPLVGQQLIDPAVQLRRQPGQHVLEISPRLMPIELGRLQQAHHHGGALATQADEPDSQRIAITVPDPMQNVSNGRLRLTTHNADGTTTFEWFVTEPINNYDVAVNAGSYAHFSDVFNGEAGSLTMDFWPLAYHLDTAKVQWQQAKPMMSCFEHWFGPYPWYADGYKLVEAPHLGMEHQTAVAYGNHFKNGYYAGARGQERWIDFSGMGEGYKWDFIIVHESAHEWFGNNITTKDIADSWVHESFANYAEGIFSECQDGKEAGARYLIGSRRQIHNDAPIIGPYGVNTDGSGDMYYKGGSMLHTMRQVVDNDDRWRGVLRGLNKTFWHQTVTGRQVMDYIDQQSGFNFDKVFEQYLTTTRVPTLEYRIRDNTLSFRWVDVVPGFDLPVKVTLNGNGYAWIRPTESWRTADVKLPHVADFKVDENFYVNTKNVGY